MKFPLLWWSLISMRQVDNWGGFDDNEAGCGALINITQGGRAEEKMLGCSVGKSEQKNGPRRRTYPIAPN